MMKKLLSVLTATILATAFALPLSAAPMFKPKTEQMQALEPVKSWKKGHGNRYWRNGRHWKNRYAWRNCGYYGSCYPRRYYGYRNYYRPYYPRYYRPYYPGYYPRSGFGIYLSF